MDTEQRHRTMGGFLTRLRKVLESSRVFTFQTHVTWVESNESGLVHVASEVLSKGFWVGGRQSKHLFVDRQRGEDPAEGEQGDGVNFSTNASKPRIT